MLGDHQKARRSRVPAYLLLSIGGLIIWIDPTRNVEPVPWGFRWVWASCIVVGGLVSMLGAIKDWWICEFGTLPLLGAGFALLVIVLAAGEGTGRLAFAAWIAAIVWILAARWLSLLRFVRANKRAWRKSGG